MTLKRVLLAFAVIFVLFIIFLGYQSISKGSFSILGNQSSRVTVKERTFTVEVAKTEKDKQIGLAKYNSLADDRGMLFQFSDPAIYSFWMKDMKFPIDIIFIRDNKIVTIHSNVQPPAGDKAPLPIYQPRSAADTVLEIKAGLAKKYQLKEGDTVQIAL